MVNMNNAFNSPLKLVTAGYRHPSGAFEATAVGARALLWTSTTNGDKSTYVYFGPSGAGFVTNTNRAMGNSIRCILD